MPRIIKHLLLVTSFLSVACAASADAGAKAHSAVQAAEERATWKGMRMGTNFWFLASWGEQAWKDKVDFATTDDPWNPAFISDLEQANYSVYRFMDFGGTNNSKLRNWSDRTTQDSPANQDGGNVNGPGIAYEWMFDLCNRMQRDCWINVPHLAIETYEQNPEKNFFTELAQLAKKHLDPGLTLYIEYSNETWNYGFEQANYCKDRGTQLGLDSDPYVASTKFHVYASSRMNDAFAKVFGKEKSRVKWVVASQLGVPYYTGKQLDALKDARINHGKRTPDYYSVSAYVGLNNTLDGASATVEEDFQNELTTTLQAADQIVDLIKDTGMKLVAYEGGQHALKNADKLSANPLMYDLYHQWLEEISSRYVLTMHYSNSGSWSPGGAWGAKPVTGGSLKDAPKARALVDWIHKHPTE